MTTLTLELSEEKALELIREAMRFEIFKGYLEAKRDDDLLYVKEIKKIINAE